MYKLQYNDSGKSIWLIGEKLSVGSSADNGIVIEGSGISEHHATIFIDGDKITLSPVAGAPSTVNGAKITSNRDLKLGDVVSFANIGMELILPETKTAVTPQVSKAGKAAPKINPEDSWQIIGGAQQRHSIFGTMVVGRSPDCDITFSYERLSRRHAQLHESDGVLWVTDLESANGTFVNGKRLEAVERLKNGDKLSFEKLKFVVKGPLKAAASAVATDDDDVGKTVIGSAIDSAAIKKAQQELADKKRKRDVELKAAAKQTMTSQAKISKPKKTDGNNTVIIIVGVVIVAVIGVAVLVLL